MLTAIELSGFKSFADKTRMEFVSGISAPVGPNGSGKSNVVDAIKWVLGEQSIKKLRGNESTDVIFNGSGTRQPVNSAEVTLTFDNSLQIFDIEASEVHITRRVYRSGETEYLINRQPSRLKDIKDILSGTGLGTQAYGIIEQGRVEALLQSSSIQRRSIFEEAAGISRFNTKKLEVQRRLERIDQNILRLSDIVGEIETQLRNTKSQAGKAQLYRQYTIRLQELRVHAGWVDWQQWSGNLKKLQTELAEITEKEKSLVEIIDENEKRLSGYDHIIEELTRESKRIGEDVAGITERITGETSSIELQLGQVEELDAEIVRNGQQLLTLTQRNTDTDELMRKTDEEIRVAYESHQTVVMHYEKHLAETENLARQFDDIETRRDQLRNDSDAKHRLLNRLAGEMSGFESRQAGLAQARAKNEKQRVAVRQQLYDTNEQAKKYRVSCDEFAQKAERYFDRLEAAKKQRLKRQEELETLREELLDLKQRQSGTSERIAVLEELLKRHEGLSPGVKEVLREARTPDSPYRHVHGLVADLFRVHVEAASLIELALGQAAQHIVVTPDTEIIKAIERNAGQYAGRVGFIWLNMQPNESSASRRNPFEGRPGVLGRADQFVETESQYSTLAQRLLGRTLIVETLGHAKSLYSESDGRTNFLTITGEYLAGDGTLVLGPLYGTSGLISRRSELRTLNEQLTRIESRVRDLELNQEVLQLRCGEDEQTLEQVTREHQQIVTEWEFRKNKASNAEERMQQVELQLKTLTEESESLETQYEKTAVDIENTQTRQNVLEAEITVFEAELVAIQQSWEMLNERQREMARKTTNIKIELAKSEGRLDFLNDRRQQFKEHQKERLNLLVENRKRDTLLKIRGQQALLAILKIESDLALLYYRKELLAADAKKYEKERQEIIGKRVSINGELKQLQNELNKVRTTHHQRQLEIERTRQEMRTLSDRMQEDYHIDIAIWAPETPQLAFVSALANAPEAHRTDRKKADIDNTKINVDQDVSRSDNDDAKHRKNDIANESLEDQAVISIPISIDYQVEIDELRGKLQKIGSVNLEAIETLETLETRFTTLSNQYQDLLNAKKTIEKIIERINTDSQRLFEETFFGVKEYFRTLFQKLFGGGHADLVLEDETRPLECGVEIVARPPGKELKSVTLMSGGEKTLTCVALLLALFSYRPSPICILDEVDAALDEANIDRFARVIKEFEVKTQFLIVTHSKKTMASANTIYGVTMQDSGVSIPISVRFVDVGENGEINIANSSQNEAA